MLTQQQQNQFIHDGYLVLPNYLKAEKLSRIRKVTEDQLSQRFKPFELEADVKYPGAPEFTDAPGGSTIRRLLHAFDRHDIYRDQAQDPQIIQSIKSLLSAKEIFLSPNHHNCVMTKQPEHSSQTNWHRDTRYWHFNNKYLINAWYALGDESSVNGGMLILPGSHRWDVNDDALDDAQFLIEDHPKNQARLSMAKQVDLKAGDCLLFSAHCFHAAGANQTQQAKFSMVFTYHSEHTQSLPNTKSSIKPSVKIQ